MPPRKDPNPNLRNLRNRPVCIICARPTEAEEIAKTLGILDNGLKGHEVEKVNDGHTFYLGSFKLAKGELEYYVTSGLRQGIQSFTVSASVLFTILLPRFVVHAGVCAGYDDQKLKMRLTDVVFGEAAINYEEGKWEGLLFRPDYNRVSAFTGDMQAFAESRDRPKYHYGEYISGSAVRTDAGALFEQVRRGMCRNAIALDMEASAFIQLCEHFGKDYAKCLGVVKGISDFGNAEKGKVENTYFEALQNTALALREWITHSIPVIDWEIDEEHEPGAKIVPGYYKNFVSRVLDNFCMGWDITLKNDSSVVIPRQDVKGFKTVLPKGRQPAFFSEMGNIMAIKQKYGIIEVAIGGDQGSRYLYYKAGYLMDWSRCCNTLTKYEDGAYQVEVFERMLSKNHYYSNEDEGPAHASVCTWEETEAWLKEVAAKEQKDTTRDVGEQKNEEEADEPRKEAVTNGSRLDQSPAFVAANRIERTPGGQPQNKEVGSHRSSKTFPPVSPKFANDPSRDGRKAKTGFFHVHKKLSIPRFFRKTPS